MRHGLGVQRLGQPRLLDNMYMILRKHQSHKLISKYIDDLYCIFMG